MMWVLPLVIYLASFTLCFDGDRWYAPRAYRAATLVAVLAMALLLYRERQISNLAWHIGGFLVGLFVVCMFCHGELARSRPAASRLTHFYLAVSAGGVAGGALVALGAPALLPGYFEVEIGLVLLALALLWRTWSAGALWRLAGFVVLAASVVTAAWRMHDAQRQVIEISRNFYGVLRIRDHATDDSANHERVMLHGRILHGQQFLSPERRRQPTSYYTEASGIGRLLRALADRPLRVGAVGLGAGTIATYGKPGDHYRFYEIDPAIVEAAHRHFSFIADSPATVDVRVGDGRLLLQDEAPASLDVVVVDAFSGDAIPTHLLTREAIALYRQRLKPGGVMALHLSNSHLDLRGVVARIAADLGLQWAYVADPGVAGDVGSSASDWVLLAEDRGVLDQPLIAQAARPLPQRATARAWTDDYSNIAQVLSFGRTD
jgi:SAM-dependent methyltransferase